jgi:hypothetical protein
MSVNNLAGVLTESASLLKENETVMRNLNDFWDARNKIYAAIIVKLKRGKRIFGGVVRI